MCLKSVTGPTPDGVGWKVFAITKSKTLHPPIFSLEGLKYVDYDAVGRKDTFRHSALPVNVPITNRWKVIRTRYAVYSTGFHLCLTRKDARHYQRLIAKFSTVASFALRWSEEKPKLVIRKVAYIDAIKGIDESDLPAIVAQTITILPLPKRTKRSKHA